MADHDLFFARVTNTSPGRLGDPPLLCSARHGWRVTGGKAREPGMSIRDRLLERLAKEGVAVEPEADGEPDPDAVLPVRPAGPSAGCCGSCGRGSPGRTSP
jgi:hypothetical protein